MRLSKRWSLAGAPVFMLGVYFTETQVHVGVAVPRVLFVYQRPPRHRNVPSRGMMSGLTEAEFR